VLESIIKAEAIQATEEDIEKEISEYAKQSGHTDEEFKKNLSENGKSYFTDIATTKKAVDFLKTNAVPEKDDSGDDEVIVDAE
jgi:trigger factor